MGWCSDASLFLLFNIHLFDKKYIYGNVGKIIIFGNNTNTFKMEKNQIQHIVGKEYATGFVTNVPVITAVTFMLLAFLFGSLPSGALFGMIGAIIVGCCVFYCVGRYSPPAQGRYLIRKRDAFRELTTFLSTKEQLTAIGNAGVGVITALLSSTPSERCLGTAGFSSRFVAQDLNSYRHELEKKLKMIEDKTPLKNYDIFSEEVWKSFSKVLLTYELVKTTAVDTFQENFEKIVSELHLKNLQFVEYCNEEDKKITTFLQTEHP